MANETEIVEKRVKELERAKNSADIDYKRKQADYTQARNEWSKKGAEIQKKIGEVEEKLAGLDAREKELKELAIAYDASVMDARRKKLRDEFLDLKSQLSEIEAQGQVETQPILTEMDKLNDVLKKAQKAWTGEKEYLEELRDAKEAAAAPPAGSKRRANKEAQAKANATDAAGKDVTADEEAATAPPA